MLEPPAIEPSAPWYTPVTSRLAALRASPIALLAASVVFAGGFGAIVGAVASTKFYGEPKTPLPVARTVQTEDVRALTATITQLKGEVVALKTAADNANRNATTQLARINERVERIDKGQAEPAAKLAKLAEAVERLDQKAATTTATKDITGSVPQRTAGVPAAVPLPPEPAKLAILEGWRVRSVYDGAALIQGRHGLIEVAPGDTLPGGGRIERIARQDGRWVVVTSKGLITSVR